MGPVRTLARRNLAVPSSSGCTTTRIARPVWVGAGCPLAVAGTNSHSWTIGATCLAIAAWSSDFLSHCRSTTRPFPSMSRPARIQTSIGPGGSCCSCSGVAPTTEHNAAASTKMAKRMILMSPPYMIPPTGIIARGSAPDTHTRGLDPQLALRRQHAIAGVFGQVPHGFGRQLLHRQHTVYLGRAACVLGHEEGVVAHHH